MAHKPPAKTNTNTKTKTKAKVTVEVAVANILSAVLGEGTSLTAQLCALEDQAAIADRRAKIQAQCYTVLRFLPRIEKILKLLLKKPLPAKALPVKCILYLGLMQLLEEKRPSHAIVNGCVQAVVVIGDTWARGLVNACLRRFIRERDSLLETISQDPVARFSHPSWMIKQIKKDWPDHFDSILKENNKQAPMTLRVNRLQITRDQYLKKLAAASIDATPVPHTDYGLQLASPVAVDKLPGFAEGNCSVQDGAGQLMLHYLQAQLDQEKHSRHLI